MATLRQCWQPGGRQPLWRRREHPHLDPPPHPAAGIVGTLAGGALLDLVGSTLTNAMLLCAVGMAGGAGLVLLAFAAAGSFPAFSALFAVGQLAMFTSQAPNNAGKCGWVQLLALVVWFAPGPPHECLSAACLPHHQAATAIHRSVSAA